MFEGATGTTFSGGGGAMPGKGRWVTGPLKVARGVTPVPAGGVAPTLAEAAVGAGVGWALLGIGAGVGTEAGALASGVAEGAAVGLVPGALAFAVAEAEGVLAGVPALLVLEGLEGGAGVLEAPAGVEGVDTVLAPA